ncbi:phosphatidylinositol mannoside acyltransferase [Naumannella halotolerans]|uniref:KDO2-lipid IV(A) lauroyltransferase n=1 Tax=Naumannella halotolerans TaxID=993414 RepID=A0A4R7J7S3_9ACTN|nr:phosphatidylinositol mannoside acyltransferase [Naumannella halotolerans]TDT33305.1 KDO2-lipid IV(A) lauroyltransferase [Naumannella halotolerans]
MTEPGTARGPADIRNLLPAAGVDARNRFLFARGQQIAPHLPSSVQNLIMNLGSAMSLARPSPEIDNWIANITAATGTRPGRALQRQAIRSYLRTYLEVLALPSWGPLRTATAVSAEPTGERILRLAHTGPGVVCALPHSANWDLAGGWAAATGMPVTSVAERLGETEFAAFTEIRRRLGIEILAHDDSSVVRELIRAVRNRRVVCLMGDRDLTGDGVPVRWNGHPITMPAGPALVARRTGAVLLGVGCHYTATGMKIDFSAPIPLRPGRGGLVAMTQELADFFAAHVARHPADWHLMQPFFDRPVDRVRRRRTPAAPVRDEDRDRLGSAVGP